MKRETYDRYRKGAAGNPLIFSYLKKFQEDPASRVFAPLAEAYRKAGLVDEAIDIARETAVDDGVGEVCVIGGTAIFEATLPKARRLYITEVEAEPEGDAVFPAFDESGWREISNERHEAGEKDDHAFSFRVLERL